jgi:flagellar M-ring protein FliF
MFGMIRQGLLGLMVFLVLLLAFLSSRRSKKKAKAAALSSSEQDELMRTLRAGQNVLDSGRTQPEIEAASADGERSRIRQDVGELVDRQPDEVAALLRGWLADRREG